MRDDAPAGEAMVELRGVSKAFGGQPAVQGAGLALPRGEFLTILGPSGCGKTTLLRMIAGFLAPDAGTIRIGGRDMAGTPAHHRSIGMVFQRLALFPHMTVAGNVAYPLRMRGFPKAGIPERIERTLRLVRLDGFGDRRPHELSGGQQQRVAIARALSYEPDLLLLDEPLSALNRKLREEMQLEFRRIQRELGVTTINVTHDQREALVMSDRILVMDGGRVQQADRPEAVYRRPSNRFVATFIGLTSTFRARVESVEGARATLAAGRTRLSGRAGALRPGDAAECAIRAERVRLLRPGDPEPDTTLEGSVAERIFEGDRIVYELSAPALGGGPVYAFEAMDRAEAAEPVDNPVRFGWNADDLLVFPAEPDPRYQGEAR